MAEENSTGNNLIWAITLLIIVTIIAWAVYSSGLLGSKGGTKKEININITTPAR